MVLDKNRKANKNHAPPLSDHAVEMLKWISSSPHPRNSGHQHHASSKGTQVSGSYYQGSRAGASQHASNHHSERSPHSGVARSQHTQPASQHGDSEVAESLPSRASQKATKEWLDNVQPASYHRSTSSYRHVQLPACSVTDTASSHHTEDLPAYSTNHSTASYSVVDPSSSSATTTKSHSPRRHKTDEEPRGRAPNRDVAFYGPRDSASVVSRNPSVNPGSSISQSSLRHTPSKVSHALSGYASRTLRDHVTAQPSQISCRSSRSASTVTPSKTSSRAPSQSYTTGSTAHSSHSSRAESASINAASSYKGSHVSGSTARSGSVASRDSGTRSHGSFNKSKTWSASSKSSEHRIVTGRSTVRSESDDYRVMVASKRRGR